MLMLYFALFILGSFGLVLIVRPLTTLIHELGHAIPAVLLTKQRVTMYVGSYGKSEGSIHIRISLLDIYFKYNPFTWGSGLCAISATRLSINRQIAYIVTGPLASSVISFIACYIAFSHELHGFLKLFLVIFLGSGILDLALNLLPIEAAIVSESGNTVYRDGYQIKLLFYYKRFSEEHDEAVELYQNGQYTKASSIFLKLLKNGLRDQSIYYATIASCFHDNNHKQAIDVYEKYAKHHKLNIEDLSTLGTCHAALGKFEKGIDFFDLVLKQDPNHKRSILNKAYTLSQLFKFKEAIELFDKCSDSSDNLSYIYANRGLCNIKIGEHEEGLEEIKYSVEIDSNNAYGYKNLGVYHFEKEEFQDALKFLKKAKEINKGTHDIDRLLDEVNKRMASNIYLHNE